MTRQPLETRWEIGSAIVVATLTAFYFWPILHSGLIDGDAYFQHLSAAMSLNGEGAVDVYRQAARAYDSQQDGWYPVGSIPLSIWLADPPPFFAKLAQLGLITINFATFALLARRLFGNFGASILATAILLGIWQLRIPHDPILGTSFLTPWAAEAILACYTCWLWYAETRRRLFLYFACAGMIGAILCTPIGFGIGLSFIAPSIVAKSNRSGAIAIFLAAFVTGLISILHGTHVGGFAALGTYDANAIAQLVAPLPTTFRAFGHLPIAHVAGFWHGTRYVDDRFIRIPEINPTGWLRTITLTTFTYYGAQRATAHKLTAGKGYLPLLCGLTLWLVPTIMAGWQHSSPTPLPLGQSLDSVYFQCFGIAILGTYCFLTIARSRPQLAAIAPPIAAMTIFLLAYGNIRSDSFAINQTVQAEYPRDVIQRASEAGFFKLVPPDSTIAAPNWGPLVTGAHSSSEVAEYMLYHFTRLRFHVIDTDTTHDPPPNTWVLGTSHLPYSLVSLSHWSASSNGIILTDESLHFSIVDFGTIFGSPRGISLSSTQLADGNAIFAKRTCGAVPIESALAPETPHIEWGSGFYPPGPFGYASRMPIRQSMFMGPSAELRIIRASCGLQPLQFHAIVEAPNPGTLSFGVRKHQQRLQLSNVQQAISINLPPSNSPITLEFATDAKPADLNPVYFRYDHDRPLDTRLTLSGASVTELAAPSPIPHVGAR